MSAAQDMSRLAVTFATAAAALDCDRATVRRMWKAGHIRVCYPFGPKGHPRIPVSELERVVNETICENECLDKPSPSSERVVPIGGSRSRTPMQTGSALSAALDRLTTPKR